MDYISQFNYIRIHFTLGQQWMKKYYSEFIQIEYKLALATASPPTYLYVCGNLNFQLVSMLQNNCFLTPIMIKHTFNKIIIIFNAENFF